MRLVFLASAAVALCAASAANATIIADFELNGTLANSAGTGATLTNNAGAGSLGASGITFGMNGGPTISGLTATTSYTIDMLFTLSNIDGTRNNGYVKLIDFSNLLSDGGYYSHFGKLNAFPTGDSANVVFAANTPTRLTLSRDTLGNVAGYINDIQIYSVFDPSNSSSTAIAGALTFFADDSATAFQEAAPGFIDYIRIYDTAVTPAQAMPVPPVVSGAVPEPASWAMMVGGFGLVGSAFRRRRVLMAQA